MATNITSDVVSAVNTGLWSALANQYGDIYSVPADARWRASEIVRSLWVLAVWQREGGGRHPFSFLRAYGVPDDIAQYAVTSFTDETALPDDAQRPEKRKDKWATFEAWARDHVGEQFSMDALVEISGFSYPTTLNYVKQSLYFRKIKKGLYEATAPPERRED